MGFQKFKRPILSPSGAGLDVAAASTFSDQVTLSGGVVLTGMTAGEYLTEYVQTLTGANGFDSAHAGTDILGYGITKITIAGASQTTANDFIFNLDPPVAAGVTKIIVLAGNTSSTKQVTIRTDTSTHTFFGSTKNSLTWATGVLGSPAPVILAGLATTKWALVQPLVWTSTATATPWSIAGATA